MSTDKNQYTNLLKACLVLSKNIVISPYYNDLVEVTSSTSGSLMLHKDILLVLMEFTKPKPVVEFLEFFSTVEDIQLISTLDFLYTHGILQVADDSLHLSVHDGSSDISEEENLFFNLHNHHMMLMDYVRTETYRRAIESTVKPGDVILELGCGSGILSFFAAKKGAEKVFAIELNKKLVDTITRPLAQENNLDDKIEFILGNSRDIDAQRIHPKPDVFIAEILGDGVLNENIIQYTIDARKRFLKDDTVMIPFKVDLSLFLFELDEDYELKNKNIWKVTQVKSCDLESYYVRYAKIHAKKISNVQLIHTLDLKQVEESDFSVEMQFNAEEFGTISWGCLYFTAHLDDETKLSNAPWNPQTSWTQQIFKFNAARQVEVGDLIHCRLEYKKGRLQVMVW